MLEKHVVLNIICSGKIADNINKIFAFNSFSFYISIIIKKINYNM